MKGEREVQFTWSLTENKISLKSEINYFIQTYMHLGIILVFPRNRLLDCDFILVEQPRQNKPTLTLYTKRSTPILFFSPMKMKRTTVHTVYSDNKLVPFPVPKELFSNFM